MNEINQHKRLSSTPYQFNFKIGLKNTTESNQTLLKGQDKVHQHHAYKSISNIQQLTHSKKLGITDLLD